MGTTIQLGNDDLTVYCDSVVTDLVSGYKGKELRKFEVAFKLSGDNSEIEEIFKEDEFRLQINSMHVDLVVKKSNSSYSYTDGNPVKTYRVEMIEVDPEEPKEKTLHEMFASLILHISLENAKQTMRNRTFIKVLEQKGIATKVEIEEELQKILPDELEVEYKKNYEELLTSFGIDVDNLEKY